MECLDRAAGVQQDNLEFHKAASPYKSEYEAECDAIQQMYPDMKRSDVHNMARAKNPEAWQSHKDGKAQKMGGKKGTLPQSRDQRERSGEEPPKPTTGREGRTSPEWRSDHSGSPPLPPWHEPEKPSNDPVIKYLREQLTGWSEDRCTKLFKRFPVDVQRGLSSWIRAHAG
jgi:hypothetical protein